MKPDCDNIIKNIRYDLHFKCWNNVSSPLRRACTKIVSHSLQSRFVANTIRSLPNSRAIIAYQNTKSYE